MILCVLASALVCFGQEFRASLTGHVSDPAGAVIPGATVRVRSNQTGQETTGTTTEDGNYTVPSLLPGVYTVTVEAQGFKSSVTENLELHVNDKATLDVTLEVGAVGDVVTVNAEDTPLLERDTATRGQVIENRRIVELPLNGRNPIMLATLSPGVQWNGNPQFSRPFDNGDNVQFSINGGIQRHNEFLLDGAPNNAVTDFQPDRIRSSNNIAYVPPVDGTQEFKVQTNSYDASFGRTGGGVVNVSTKAGGNAFHGTLYEFARRYQWEANDPSAKAAGRPRFARDPVTGENLGGRFLDQYGGNFGGPIYVPRFGEGGPRYFSGRDKAFFFVAYERYREGLPEPALRNVPTLAERSGDFSQAPFTIYDPLTTRVDPNNPNRFIRDPFPGNIIPQNRLNPIGLAIANGFPLPNTGAAGARTNNFINSPNLGRDEFYNFVLRGDANIGERHHLFARYVRNKRNQFSGFEYPGLGRDAQDPLVRGNNGVAVDWVATLTPNTVLNLRATYTRFVQAAFRRTAEGFDATSIGFPSSFNAARPVAIVPRFEFSTGEFSNFGPRNPSQNTTNIIALQGNVSTVRGSHTIRVGGEVRDNRINARGASFSFGGGQFAFNRNFTQLDPSQPQTGTQGSALASLLLGYPASGVVTNLAYPAFRWRYYAPYIQDDIKVSRKLTVTLGLRYDYEAPPTERFNQMNRGFAFDQTSPLQAQIAGRPGVSECPACGNLRGGLLFAGVGGQPEEAFERDRNNFQPRVGAAYELNDKTVLRGGYGLYYFPQAEFGGTLGYTINTPFVAAVGGGAQAFIPANTLSNPFPTGILTPVGSSQGLLTQAGNSIEFANPDHEIPKIHQFSFGVQRQLPGGFKLDVAYVGSRSVDVLTGDFNVGGQRNINVLSAAQLADARQNPAFYNAQVPNPFAGLLPGTGLNGATVARRQLLLPFPQFQGVTVNLENVGKVWYDSLQISGERRTASGLTMIASYTFSKTMSALNFLNPQDAEPSKSVADFDRPHVFVLSGVYQLPFGRDRRFLSDAGTAANLLLGGWEYNFIARFQSGQPVNLGGDFDLIADPTIEDNTAAMYFNTCTRLANGTTRQPNAAGTAFVTGCSNPAWQARGADTLRTTPFRIASLRVPSPPQFDMSLNKSFIFTESLRAQFRVEAFNVTNTGIFGGPNTDPNSTQFGRRGTGIRNFPRQIQLGFKFYF
ncbi:MAG TPA: TonB-dependent receptor [Pyrinomonadaceae bacterium]|nr:TonB-dependent receptor [Pyrinomonadaceae bacterium]